MRAGNSTCNLHSFATVRPKNRRQALNSSSRKFAFPSDWSSRGLEMPARLGTLAPCYPDERLAGWIQGRYNRILSIIEKALATSELGLCVRGGVRPRKATSLPVWLSLAVPLAFLSSGRQVICVFVSLLR